jgi:hypothetical protein
MFRLDDIYNRLQSGTPGAPRSGNFVEPDAGPIAGTGHTLNDIMGIAPGVDDVAGAQPAQILQGRTYWSLLSGTGWGLQSGTMANIGQQNITPAAINRSISAGFHNGTGQVAGDADLVTGNIRGGVNLFNVTGDPNVVNTGSGTATATDLVNGVLAWVDGAQITGTRAPGAVPKTGQTASLVSGDDGDLQRGVVWPVPRFTSNGNGTVTDNLSGLIWLQQSNTCVGPVASANGTSATWQQALDFANALAAGACGLNDGSVAGSWRLPNARELQSLIDFGNLNPALPTGHPFSGVVRAFVWSSTSVAATPANAWSVFIGDGDLSAFGKTSVFSVWPVRGGQ